VGSVLGSVWEGFREVFTEVLWTAGRETPYGILFKAVWGSPGA
jgi:hypothetical protein